MRFTSASIEVAQKIVQIAQIFVYTLPFPIDARLARFAARLS